MAAPVNSERRATLTSGIFGPGNSEVDNSEDLIPQRLYYRRSESKGPYFGKVENLGGNDFTFRVMEATSPQQDPDDHTGPLNLRVNGATVTTVTVRPGGAVQFLVEGASTSKDILVFEAVPVDAEDPQRAYPYGYVSLAHFGGQLDIIKGA